MINDFHSRWSNYFLFCSWFKKIHVLSPNSLYSFCELKYDNAHKALSVLIHIYLRGRNQEGKKDDPLHCSAFRVAKFI